MDGGRGLGIRSQQHLSFSIYRMTMTQRLFHSTLKRRSFLGSMYPSNTYALLRNGLNFRGGKPSMSALSALPSAYPLSAGTGKDSHERKVTYQWHGHAAVNLQIEEFGKHGIARSTFGVASKNVGMAKGMKHGCIVRAVSTTPSDQTGVDVQMQGNVASEKFQSTAYPFSKIESKWQAHWEEHQTFRTPEFKDLDTSKPKFYALDMFPYPRYVVSNYYFVLNRVETYL